MKREFRKIPIGFDPQKPAKKNQTAYLTGSVFGRRGESRQPQIAPPSASALPFSEKKQIRVEDWVSLRLQGVHRRVPDFDQLAIFKFSMPTCQHGLELTQAMARLEWQCKRKYFFPINFDCFDCNPTCGHGTPLNIVKDKKAIEARLRVSKLCPKCDPTITDPKLINAYLLRQNLNVNAHRGLIVDCVVTRYGQVITRGDAYFMLAGGGSKVEDLDQRATNRTDLPAGAGIPKDIGSDTYDDVDGDTTDELGDPVWTGNTDFTRAAEKLRTSETRDTLSTPSTYKVAQSSLNRKWYILKDGEMLADSSGHTIWFKTKTAAEKRVNRQLIEDHASETIEHKAEQN